MAFMGIKICMNYNEPTPAVQIIIIGIMKFGVKSVAMIQFIL